MIGKYTAIDPPRLVDGLLCSGAAVFRPGADSPASPTSICSGTVEAHDGGRAVFERAFQPYSRLVVEGVGDSRQERYECLMGGNIASTTDPERGLSELATGDTQSRRGDDARKRVRPGDLAYYETGGVRRSGVVKSAEAYAVEPAQVAWQSATPVPALTGFVHEIGVHQAEQVGLFAPTETGVFGFAGLFDGATELTRVTFTSAENYPANASLGSGEYWYSNSTGVVRYGPTAGATLQLRYAAGPFNIVGTGTGIGDSFIMDGDGDYANAADDAQRASHEAIGNISTTVEIKSSGADGYGRGSYEWRLGYGDDAPMIAVRWNETHLVDAVYRATTGGALITTAVNVALSGAFFLFIVRTGTSVKIDYDINGTPGTADTRTFAGIDPDELATVAFGGRGVPYIAEDTTARTLRTNARVLWKPVFEDFANTGDEVTFTLPDTTSVTSVVNQTSGATMTASATARRDTYRQDASGEITFYSTSALDSILVTQAAPALAPGGAGIPPRMPGTVDYADGGTAVADNRAHWNDAVEFEDGWLPPVGAVVQFQRGAVFSPDDPPELWFDQPGGFTTDWRRVPSNAFKPRWADGVVFFSQDFLGELQGNACFQARGNLWTHDGSLKSAQLEALAKRVEFIDELWTSVGVTGTGLTSTIGNTGDTRAIRNTAVVCEGATTKRTDYQWAGPRGLATGLADEFDTAGAAPPAWRSGTELILGSGFLEFTTAWRDTIIGNCSGNDLTRVEIDGMPGGGRVQRAYPYSLAGALAGNYVGSFVPNFSGSTLSAFDGTAQFIAPSLGATPMLARLAGLGAVCVEARARVRFPGLEFFDFTHDFVIAQRSLVDGNPISGDRTGSDVWTYNGAVVYESTTNAAGTTTVTTPNPDPFPSPITTGAVGFSLIGEEVNSERIEDIFGNIHNVRNSRFRTLGTVSPADSGVVSTAWKVIEFTGIINTILADRTRATNYLLWPRVGSNPPVPGTGLAAYLQSLESEVTLEVEERATDLVAFTGSVRNSLARWTSFDIESIHARFRLPDGIEESIRIPFITQPPLA